MELHRQLAETLARVQAHNPLVHQLTNFVTANDCANITLALGASPVMANDPLEAADMSAAADALLLNIGTLDHSRLPSMLLAGQTAAAKGIPVVFDPVGVGSTAARTAAARQILRQVPLTVVRGNQSEIRQLAGFAAAINGVDAGSGPSESGDMTAIARELSQRLGCTVCVTGRQDIVADSRRLCLISNGHPLLGRVSGTGCMAGSLIACCCAVCGDPFLAAICGLSILGIAGETAHASLAATEGLGSFRMRLFDAVSALTPAAISSRSRITITVKEALPCHCVN